MHNDLTDKRANILTLTLNQTLNPAQSQKDALCTLTKLEFKLLKIFKNLEKNTEASRILLNVQVSGGQDSMCLLHSINRVLNSKYFSSQKAYFLIAQHFNHQLRGSESDGDADFVSNQCLALGIPFYLSYVTYPQHKVNLQKYAHEYRKRSAQELSSTIKNQLDCQKYFILTAHHGKDHVETVLMHMLRGTGINGLTGIQFNCNKNIFIKPFSHCSFNEIKDYCEQRKISYRTDSSNLKETYLRNYIRLNILPHFAHVNPQYETAFRKLSDQAQRLTSANIYAVNGANAAKNTQKEHDCQHFFEVFESSSVSDIYLFFQQIMPDICRELKTTFFQNIHHESRLLLSTGKKNAKKKISFKGGHIISLERQENLVRISLDEKNTQDL